MTTVSVIVCTYSKEHRNYVSECIESLRRQTTPPTEIILVVDTLQGLKEYYSLHVPPGVTVVESGASGLSNARNAGVTKATGEIVAFIDDDATADERWLQNLIQSYDENSVQAVGGMAVASWENGRPSWFPEELDWVVGCTYLGFPSQKGNIRNPLGSNMSFRRTTFYQVGLFKTSVGRIGKLLRASEEAEFSIRVSRFISNSTIVYEPTAVVHHKVPKERAKLSYLIRRSYYEGVSKRRLKSEHSNYSSALLAERRYVTFLLHFSIPRRLRLFYRYRSLLELFCILLSATVVVAGYLVEGLRQTLQSHGQDKEMDGRIINQPVNSVH